MKYLLASIGANLVSMACVVGAVYLVGQGKPEWGWFLAGAVLCCTTLSWRDNTE
jgi:hypothetical protein